MARKSVPGNDLVADSNEAKNDNVLVAVHLLPELLKQVDDIRWSHRIEGRAATVRLLIEKGIEQLANT